MYLCFFNSVSLKQSLLLFSGQQLVLWNKNMVLYINQKLPLLKSNEIKMFKNQVIYDNRIHWVHKVRISESECEGERGEISSKRKGKESTWKTSRWNFWETSCKEDLAKGVRFVFTTKIPLSTFSVFIFSTYCLICFTPTFGSSGKNTYICCHCHCHYNSNQIKSNQIKEIIVWYETKIKEKRMT